MFRGINVLDRWSVCSPHPNPIENQWGMLARQMCQLDASLNASVRSLSETRMEKYVPRPYPVIQKEHVKEMQRSFETEQQNTSESADVLKLHSQSVRFEHFQILSF